MCLEQTRTAFWRIHLNRNWFWDFRKCNNVFDVTCCNDDCFWLRFRLLCSCCHLNELTDTWMWLIFDTVQKCFLFFFRFVCLCVHTAVNSDFLLLFLNFIWYFLLHLCECQCFNWFDFA
jgi:hypothetical protein